MLNYSYASNVTYLVMRMSDQSLWFLSFVLIENIRKRHKPNQLHLHIIFYCCFHELVGFTFSSKNNIWNVRKINIWSNTICFIIHWIYTFKPFLTLFFNSSKHFFPLAKFSRNWLATWQTSFFNLSLIHYLHQKSIRYCCPFSTMIRIIVTIVDIVSTHLKLNKFNFLNWVM